MYIKIRTGYRLHNIFKNHNVLTNINEDVLNELTITLVFIFLKIKNFE